jgi:hypothetical protein
VSWSMLGLPVSKWFDYSKHFPKAPTAQLVHGTDLSCLDESQLIDTQAGLKHVSY